VLIVEPELKKTKKVAPPVEEQRPETVEPAPAFDVSEIEKKIPKAFRGYIKPIVAWAQSVEQRFKAIEASMPEQIKNAMGEAIKEAQQRQFEAMKQNLPTQPGPGAPMPGGMNLGQIAQMLPYIFGGGGQDSEMLEISKDLMRAQVERIKNDMGFTDAIKNAIVSKLTGKAVESALQKI